VPVPFRRGTAVDAAERFGILAVAPACRWTCKHRSARSGATSRKSSDKSSS
jgi:hypothetical protein